MQEIEIKLQVPAAARKAVEAELAGAAGAQRMRLQAAYYDTPDRRLAAAGLALRLRKEGRRWVQTLKGGGLNAIQRLEHNVTLGPGAEIAVDIHRHAGTPAGEALAAALAAREDHKGGAAPALQLAYATDIRRLSRRLRSRRGMVELALDAGRILAGEDSQPVCELEIELVSGSPLALVDVATRLISKHGLWLDIRSKAERGDRLARGAIEVPAIKAKDVALPETVSMQEARAAVLAGCLQQVLANASEVAAGLGGAEHVHQLRVGLRRIRSAQRLFSDRGGSEGGQTAAEQSKAGASAAELFRSLGTARDRDVLVATLVPALQAAHAPPLELPPATQAVDPAALLRGREANLALLELLALSLEAAEPKLQTADLATPPSPSPSPPPLLRPLAAQQLKRWHRSIARDAARFAELDDAARHRLRKRLKRLRYSVEFVGSLFKRKRVAAYLDHLRPAQDALGLCNDLAIGEAAYRALLEQDARAWFALGWIAARRSELLGEAQVSLAALARAERFWK